MPVDFGKVIDESGTEDVTALKRCLQAIAGMPTEAVIAEYGAKLTPDEASFLRSLTEEDLNNLRHVEGRLHAALGESGDGCGIYN